MMGELAGRHALVTGGGSGIGAAIARALAAAGANVTIAGRRLSALEETAANAPRMACVSADVTDEDSVAAMFGAARAAHGPADIVVANAGAADSARFDAVDLPAFRRMIDVNLTGAFLTLRAAMPDMRARGWGRIVAVASTAGLKGYPYVAPYCAAKHGVVGLVRALAVEAARTGVTVNALCPGFVETPLLERSLRDIMQKTGRSEADARAALLGANPQGRFVRPEEVARAALWLCGPDADAVTGQAIAISGGET
jgi:3-hydroxybutyrate dehydrogenase